MIELSKYCKNNGISDKTARRRIKSGQLPAKLIDGKYFIDIGEPQEPGKSTIENLKQEKLQEEIKKLRRSDKEWEEFIRSSERGRFREKLLQVTAKIPESFRLAKLSEEQYKIISDAFLSVIENLKQEQG